MEMNPNGREAWFCAAGHEDPDSPNNMPMNTIYQYWHVNLQTGSFTRLPDSHTIKDNVGRPRPDGEKFELVVDRFDWRLANNQANKKTIIHRKCTPWYSFDGPNVSPNEKWVVIGESWYSESDTMVNNVARWIGWPASDYFHHTHLHVFDLSDGRRINTVPVWQFAVWHPDGDKFWSIESKWSRPGRSDGVHCRLWSVHAASPPWWLWSLTIAGVAWYAHRILRWRRRARLEPSLIT